MTQVQTSSSEFDRAIAENARYVAQFDRSALPLPPGRRLAVLACMDARLTVEDVLALRPDPLMTVATVPALDVLCVRVSFFGLPTLVGVDLTLK